MPDWIYPSGFKLWGDEERAAIARVIDSDQYTMAGEAAALEAEIAAYHGRKYAVACNSGSSANWLTVASLFHKSEAPLQIYDAVIAPSIAWATTWSVLLQHNLHIYLADIDGSWNVPRYHRTQVDARMVVTCPILGNPAHIAEWYDTGDAQNLYVWEDACEALGAITEDGRRIGTLGHVSSLSFYMSHQIGGIEGGIVLTDDRELYDLMRELRNHGWDRDTRQADVPFDQEYNFLRVGMNLRPLEINCAVQREQLKKLDGFVAARRENLAYFAQMVEGLPIRMQQMSGSPSPFGISFEVQSAEVRSRLATALRAEGVDCRLPTGGSARMHPLMMAYSNQQTPRADALHARGIFIGNAPFEVPHLIDKAVAVMKRTL